MIFFHKDYFYVVHLITISYSEFSERRKLLTEYFCHFASNIHLYLSSGCWIFPEFFSKSRCYSLFRTPSLVPMYVQGDSKWQKWNISEKNGLSQFIGGDLKSLS